MDEFDFVVIGGGSAGYAAARTAVDAGMSVAVVDGSSDLGGLCILRGCMPSKAIIESANRFLTLKNAGDFGLSATDISADAKKIIERKRRLVSEFAAYRVEQLKSGKFELVRGKATFQDKHTLQVTLLDGSVMTLNSRTFIIATGSQTAWPAVPGLREAECLTSDEALELESIPESMVVLGGGPVALELAHYFDAIGTRVDVVQRSSQVLKGVDRDVAEALTTAMRERGIAIHLDTDLRNVSPGRVQFECRGELIDLNAEVILQGLGREPNTAGLGLRGIGMQMRGRHIATDAGQRTNVENIFAAGDVTGPHEIVHIAIQQGEIAARNAARHLGFLRSAEEAIDYRLLLFATFTEPQVAVVGLSEDEAANLQRDVDAATYPFNDHGKSVVMGEMHGFVKLVVDRRTREIVGGAAVGPHASDLIHEVVVAMAFRATAAQFAAIPHYHPTLSEIWTYPAEDLA